jgi:hypothetical protein
MHRRLPLLLALLPALLALAPALCGGEEPLQRQSAVLLLSGQQVGWLTELSWLLPGGQVRTELVQQLRVERFGVPFAVSQHDLWLEGEGFISVVTEVDTNGELRRVEARAEAGGIRVTETQEGASRELFLPAQEEVLGVFGAEKRLAEALASGQREGVLRYLVFSVDTLAVEGVELRILGSGEQVDSRGGRHGGVVVEERSSGLPGLVSTELYGPDGTLLYALAPMGLPLEILPVPPGQESFAGAAPEVAGLSIPVRGLQRAAGRLDGSWELTFRFRGEGTEALRAQLLRTRAELAASPLRLQGSVGARDTLVLAIGGVVPPSEHSLLPAMGGGAGEGFTGDGLLLALADPRLLSLLGRCPAPAPGGGSAVGEWLACLEREVNQFIQQKSMAFGFAGVREILDTGAGDCTEHALLLTALLRRAGVPARLVYGFTLTEAGFIGHAWTEARLADGWHWLDPSFPGGEPYGLKLPLGVLDPAEPQWTEMGLALLRAVGGLQAELLQVSPAEGGP